MNSFWHTYNLVKSSQYFSNISGALKNTTEQIKKPEPNRFETENTSTMARMQAIGDDEKMIQMQPIEEEELLQPKLRMQPIEEEEEELIQPFQEHSGQADLQAISQELKRNSSPGNKLNEPTNRFMGDAMGADFSNVRIHTDDNAVQLSEQLQARAFTHGNDIYFNKGQYKPSQTEGKKLLAHELTHVAQQTNNLIQRAPYETVGITMDRSAIATVARRSYWMQRTTAAYVLVSDSRMRRDDEERDAVHAAFWATNPPTRVRSRSVRLLPVASRTLPAAGGGQSQTAPQLLYEVILSPPASRGALPGLEFRFLSTGIASGTPTTLPAVPQSFIPTDPLTFRIAGFPGTGSVNDRLDAYWNSHPDEHRALYHFIQNTAPANYDQVVEANTSNSGGTRVIHTSVFHIRGRHTGNTINSLTIALLNEGAVTAHPQQTVAANYHTLDATDLEIERLQARPRTADRLGTVNLPTNIPPDERLPVKFTIWQYFSQGRRNTEIDVIVPIGSGSRNIYYTIAFGTNNDVTATRIGEAGTSTGQIDIDRISVTRVSGFPGTSQSTTSLRSWWTARYPHGGTLTPDPPASGTGSGATAPTSASLIAEMDQHISQGIRNRTWFQQNYQIDVMDATTTATRLRDIHNVPPGLTSDTIDLNRTDLRMLELSLQTLSSSMLSNLQGIKLGRKTQSIRKSGNTYVDGNPSTFGLTIWEPGTGSREITVLYFQSLYGNNDNLFRGSTAQNALPDVTMGFLHELGHAAEYHTPAIETEFNSWIGRHPQTPPTWYAATNTHEMFPEFFGLFHTDPHFLCEEYPEVFSWFTHLATHGTPPTASTVLTAPTSCPP